MAARTPKLEPIDETQPGPTQDLDQVPAQDFVPVVMQDFGHAPIYDFGQAPAQDLAPQPFPGPAQIPAPVTGYHRDIILPALIEISGAIRNHDRRLDNSVTKADFEATVETAAKSQQAPERIDTPTIAEVNVALVKENADLKEQIRVKDELVESLRRTGEKAGEPERDGALPLHRVSASEGSRSARSASHQVGPDLAGMSRHGTHVDDPIILSDNESYGASDDPTPHDSESLRVKMEIDDGDANTMNLEGEAETTAPVDQKALIKMTSNDEPAVQGYDDNDVTDDQEERMTLLNFALARARERSVSPQLAHLSPVFTPWVDGAGQLNVPKSMHDDSYDELAKFWRTQMQELRSMNGSWSTMSTEKKCLRTMLLGRNSRWTTMEPGEYACGHCADEQNMCLRQYDGRLWALPLWPGLLGRGPILLQRYIPSIKLITRSQKGVHVWRD